MLTVTKRSAARAEIEGAIRCIASDSNFLAAEALASAAIDVVSGVSKAAEVQTLSDQFYEHVRPEKLKDVRKVMRKPYNFLKHSDRDRDTAIDRYNPDAAIWRTFIAAVDYDVLWQQMSFRMMLYMTWFYSRYPTILKETSRYDHTAFEATYGSMSELSRPAAVGVLKRILTELEGSEHLILASQPLAASGRIEV
ncbi:MAG: hypothetical protein QOJ91_2252 [Sphingomonadales bacterium]|nr:hypothetical protein [Sphingomonadales bacterium]